MRARAGREPEGISLKDGCGLIEGGTRFGNFHPLYPPLHPPKMQALGEDQQRACV